MPCFAFDFLTRCKTKQGRKNLLEVSGARRLKVVTLLYKQNIRIQSKKVN
jgi:hypothetical protein